MHWPELHDLFGGPSTSEVRHQNIISNPHLVDWFFTHRTESFIKHWLYDTLDAAWHWYRYEYQARRGSIHCHGTAKLRNDPGLCNLSETALKGFLAERCLEENPHNLDPKLLNEIEEGKKLLILSASMLTGCCQLKIPVLLKIRIGISHPFIHVKNVFVTFLMISLIWTMQNC